MDGGRGKPPAFWADRDGDIEDAIGKAAAPAALPKLAGPAAEFIVAPDKLAELVLPGEFITVPAPAPDELEIEVRVVALRRGERRYEESFAFLMFLGDNICAAAS